MDFRSLGPVIEQASREERPLWSYVLSHEVATSGRSSEEIMAGLKKALEVMRTAIAQGVERTEPSFSGLTGQESYKVQRFHQQRSSVLGGVAAKALTWGLAVAQINAAMGKVVAAPTAGSCGIIPGAMLAIADEHHLDDEALCHGLLTSAGIGMVVAQRASIAGASGGCQAECGSAAAMAAGAIVEMLGGGPEAVGHAVALALKSIMGLVCDPVAGLVEIPCVKRNGFGAVNALVAAEMALSGVESAIPVDEVIDAMAEVGDRMPPEYKETAKGGLAVTPTGQRMMRELYGK